MGAAVAVIGYARVSTTDQNPQLQLDALQEAGATRIYTDHGVSGSTACRPHLDASATATCSPSGNSIGSDATPNTCSRWWTSSLPEG
jgi:hypothetical protein